MLGEGWLNGAGGFGIPAFFCMLRANAAKLPPMTVKSTDTAKWICPRCRRRFARANQRHTCNAANRAEVLKNKRPETVSLFEALEAQVKSFGPVEFVARERYVILRGKHIFADTIVHADSLRLVIHLPLMARHPLFKRIVADRKWVSHMAKVRSLHELEQLTPFLRAAYDYSLSY
jgi:predicted transport protein